jgi:hypothetical protein
MAAAAGAAGFLTPMQRDTAGHLGDERAEVRNFRYERKLDMRAPPPCGPISRRFRPP